jgi:SAM-dependent methyltransferase
MTGIINWEALRQISMPPGPRRNEPGEGGNTFDNDQTAAMYNQMARMEKTYTLNQINCFETSKSDTVLDIGCGPGRISVPMAQRAGSVTSLDSSERMLAYCTRNAREAGVNNLRPCLLDWKDAELGKNLEQHDIVIACRSPGMSDFKKLCVFARKYVVVIAWANAPNIPTILGDLYAGVEGVRKFPPMRIDRRIGYNITYNQIYDAGFDPNIRIIMDGFTSDYSSREEAYQDLWRLQGTAGASLDPVFKKNVDKWLSPNQAGGFTFRRETRTYVIWFEPSQSQ